MACGRHHFPYRIIICYFIVCLSHCWASQKKTSCHVRGRTADCSRLSLTAVPANLPRNITSLDMSHNRLTDMPCPSLSPYSGLLHLNVSYNSIKMVRSLCQTLPSLQTLNVEHNEVHELEKEDLSHCVNLTRLNMASNRLKLKGEPFSTLQVCVPIMRLWGGISMIMAKGLLLYTDTKNHRKTRNNCFFYHFQRLEFLDVSKNNLYSARLSSHSQLPSLVNLNLGFNSFTTLRKDDFSFLNQSSSLQVLNLSSVTLKTVRN